MKRQSLLVFILVLLTNFSWAQSKYTVHADKVFESEAYIDALDEYKVSYTKETDKKQQARIIYQIAECFRLMNDIDNAKQWYERAIRAKHINPLQYYYLGSMLMQQGNYDEAIKYFETYKKETKNDPRGEMGIQSCTMARKWKAKPTRWQVSNEKQINSEELDFAPAFLDKRNTSIIFTSSRKGSSGDNVDPRIGENFQDVWLATRDRKGRWSEPVPFNPDLNLEESHDGSAKMNYKRNTIYFTRCEYDKKEKRGCNIFKASYVGGRLSNVEKLDLKGIGEDEDDEKDSVSVGQPSINKRDNQLIFSADLPGGQGGKDLWIITYDKKAKEWSKPKNLGPKINTAGEEVFPYIHANGSLYFSSDGHLGMGGLDIYKAESVGEDRWGNVENMKYPINSERDDYGIIFNKEKREGFFASNRNGGRGKDDIYSFYFPPLQFVLQGTVYDKESGRPIPATVISVVGSDGKVFEAQTNEFGKYEFVGSGSNRYINENTTYAISATKKDFLSAKDRISTIGAEESMTFIQDFILQYSPPHKSLEMPEVQYALGSWELLENSKDSLDYLYKILKDNPSIVVELQAHTDSRGDDESNLILSQKRAQSCVDYLISKGIKPERLSASGFGETQLRISDEEIANLPSSEQEAAHQRNRRTEFAVISTDYISAGDIEKEDK